MQWKSFAAIIAGPNALIREGVSRILRPSQFRILASASCVDNLLLNSLPDEDCPLLIIDIGIAPTASAEQMALFKRRYPTGRIAVLANHWRIEDVLLAYRAGANAYLTNISARKVLLKSLELVILGETTILPPSILRSISAVRTSRDTEAFESSTMDVHSTEDRIPSEPIWRQNGFVPQLSAREQRVLRCLLEGDANKVIARKINITDAAVKIHVKSILRKIRVHNRTQAAVWAMSHHPFAQVENIAAAKSNGHGSE
jgi:DNA-binding NarL/FixJ family response regulator